MLFRTEEEKVGEDTKSNAGAYNLLYIKKLIRGSTINDFLKVRSFFIFRITSFTPRYLHVPVHVLMHIPCI